MKTCTDKFTFPGTVEQAFTDIFDSSKTMDSVHGSKNWTATQWNSKSRVVTFDMTPENIPVPVLKVIGGGRISARVRQTVSTIDGGLKVVNKMRPRVIGAELIRIRPHFTLTQKGENTVVEFSCDQCAIMPPPICSIVENFMCAASMASFHHLREAVCT